MVSKAKGSYNIINRTTGKALASKATSVDGTAAFVITLSDRKDRQWGFEKGKGFYRLVNKQNSMALAASSNAVNGAKVHVWSMNSSKDLHWRLLKAPKNE